MSGSRSLLARVAIAVAIAAAIAAGLWGSIAVGLWGCSLDAVLEFETNPSSGTKEGTAKCSNTHERRKGNAEEGKGKAKKGGKAKSLNIHKRRRRFQDSHVNEDRARWRIFLSVPSELLLPSMSEEDLSAFASWIQMKALGLIEHLNVAISIISTPGLIEFGFYGLWFLLAFTVAFASVRLQRKWQAKVEILQTEVDNLKIQLEQEKRKRKRDALDSVGAEGTWQYEADNGEWVSFAPEISQQLMASVSKGDTTCDVVIGGVQYQEDLVDMCQTRKDNRKKRKLQCKFALPNQWLQKSPERLQRLRGSNNPFGTGCSFEAVAIPDQSKQEVFTDLLRKAVAHDNACTGGSCDVAKKIQVQEIFHIENLELYQTYTQRCRIMRSTQVTTLDIKPCVTARSDLELKLLLSPTINEKLLFHGTTVENAKQIAMQGFDFRLSKPGFYGKGVYFASQSCKSVQYSSARQGALILSRVALGDPYFIDRVNPELSRPPCKSDGGPLFDSVVAEPGPKRRVGGPTHQQVHWEFIVYDIAQAYPEYVIFYKK